MKSVVILFVMIVSSILCAQKDVKEQDVYKIIQSNPSVIIYLKDVVERNGRPMMYTINDPISDGYYEVYVGEKNNNNNAKYSTYYFYPKDLSLYEYNVVDDEKKMTEYNLAIIGITSVDSSYSGYTLTPLTDSLILTKDLKWDDAAWASSESDSEHYIKINWKSKVEINRVVVYWAIDKGELYISQKVNLASIVSGKEVDVHTDDDTDEEFGSTTFNLKNKIVTDSLLVKQPVGCGSKKRPNLLWVRELCVY